MPWNPSTYNQFKDIRYRPFFDLMSLISGEGMNTAIDVGCGTGEQTSILANRFNQTHFTGIDASPDMLALSSEFDLPNLHFEQKTIEAFAADSTSYDLIFSNAALQWSDNHEILFPALIKKLRSGGQFAVQMPCQNDNILNLLLIATVMEPPLAERLNNYLRLSPVLSLDNYADIMFRNGLTELNLSIRTYPIIASGSQVLYDFIAGSALIPYMERLDDDGKEMLKASFMKKIESAFNKYPALYAFKRLLIYGRI